MKNNAFETSKYSVQNPEKKGFWEIHGVAIGGGALALGLIVTGASYMGNENLKADLADEETVVAEDSTLSGATQEIETTQGDEEVEDGKDVSSGSESEEVSTSENTTEESEPQAEEKNEEASSESESESAETENTSAEEGESTVSDPEPSESTTQTTSQTTTDSTTTNTVPLYAEPVSGDSQESVEVQASLAERASFSDPAPLAPAQPPVPQGLAQVEPLPEGVVERNEPIDLTPKLPQE